MVEVLYVTPKALPMTPAERLRAAAESAGSGMGLNTIQEGADAIDCALNYTELCEAAAEVNAAHAAISDTISGQPPYAKSVAFNDALRRLRRALEDPK